jgi:hypothetical protein
MPCRRALEEIRLLSNLESSRHKLLQIVLFGQPELDQRLRANGMRQLNDRITHNFRLEPLRRSDVAVYLMFRLRAAGYRGPDLFTKGAIELISKASEGLTRRINILADKALLAAFSEGVHQVDRRQVGRRSRRQFSASMAGRTSAGRWAGTAAAGAGSPAWPTSPAATTRSGGPAGDAVRRSRLARPPWRRHRRQHRRRRAASQRLPAASAELCRRHRRSVAAPDR